MKATCGSVAPLFRSVVKKKTPTTFFRGPSIYLQALRVALLCVCVCVRVRVCNMTFHRRRHAYKTRRFFEVYSVVVDRISSGVPCVGARGSRAFLSRIVCPCAANVGGSRPSRRTRAQPPWKARCPTRARPRSSAIADRYKKTPEQ